MKSPQTTNLTRILLLPTNDNLAKFAAILYLLGIACTFFYYSQFNILSVDYLKPNAIILGIYQWAYFILVPRSVLLILSFLPKWVDTKLKRVVSFFILLSAVNFLLTLTGNMVSGKTILLDIILVVVIFVYHFDFGYKELNAAPSLLKTYIFSIIFCLIFSYFIFPKIPYELGGGTPVKVTVTATDTNLLKSRFSKSVYLIYTTDDDYYFVEKKQDANTKQIYGYTIKKIRKTEIKKIEFSKSIWQPF